MQVTVATVAHTSAELPLGMVIGVSEDVFEKPPDHESLIVALVVIAGIVLCIFFSLITAIALVVFLCFIVIMSSLESVTFGKGNGPQSAVTLVYRRSFGCEWRRCTTVAELGRVSFRLAPPRSTVHYVHGVRRDGKVSLVLYQSTDFDAAVGQYEAWCAYFEQYGIAPHPDRKPPSSQCDVSQ